MQTFLPYPEFTKSAEVLDYRRLGKQRVEAWQLLNILISGKTVGGWVNHPATRMWRGSELSLALYGRTICEEWIRRGYNDSLLDRFNKILGNAPVLIPPVWLGNSEFHRSHQSNLVRKDSVFYGPKFPGVPSNLPYIWPI